MIETERAAGLLHEDVRAAWVAALRSGEYRQSRKRLRSRLSKGFCVLGVLVDLAARSGVVGWDSALAARKALPTAVLEWATVRRDVSTKAYRLLSHGLAQMNDQGVTFRELAGVIEAEM